MKKKTAFIIGVTGQDGCYLSELLIKKKYKVFGFTRSIKKKNLKNLRILGIYKKLRLKKYSESNPNIIYQDILRVKPNEIYFFSGQSSVSKSFNFPLETYHSNVSILFEILELLRSKKLKKIKFYNSSSTDCFGKSLKSPKNESDLFSPLSPYGKAKSFSFWLVKYYREKYNIHSKSGILSNHESPLRTENFVLKRIINFAKKHKKNYLKLGNLKVYRDWGWAPEFVKAIHRINLSKFPDDYVVSTGKLTSLKYIVKKVFKMFDIDLKYLKTNSLEVMRPSDIQKIATNPKKIYKKLRWKSKLNIDQILKKMVLDELH